MSELPAVVTRDVSVDELFGDRIKFEIRVNMSEIGGEFRYAIFRQNMSRIRYLCEFNPDKFICKFWDDPKHGQKVVRCSKDPEDIKNGYIKWEEELPNLKEENEQSDSHRRIERDVPRISCSDRA